jgi:uncharacterized protein YjbI with pentapeptide repeats
MNQEHVEIVKSGKLNQWRKDNPEVILDFSGADFIDSILSGENLSGANCFGVDFSRANLSGADLTRTNLIRANLSWVDLSGAKLIKANLSWVDLFEANLTEANLSGATLNESRLSGANLTNTNLSNVEGLTNPTEWIEKNGEQHPEGFVFYKVFGLYYPSNPTWKIQAGREITEEVNYSRTDSCGSGVNIATLEWIRSNERYWSNIDIWQVLVKFKDLSQVCVPYSTDGNIRAGRVTLLEKEND